MATRVISIQDVSKQYIIGHRLNGSIRDSIKGIFRRKKGSKEAFWALKEISFDVDEGEAIGIIGRNGAGKSTLLKILSRITLPTKGRFEICGRVASLLEVGTGFHPELTGRENIFLNGVLLGMSRKEVRKRFDEIVDFSGVEQFLDTPVKRYSSGMYVRLAFSVAAHLEPEVLIIDEVLAVGDTEFQKRCLGKMGQIAGSGKTVLFVSHNMSAIEQICNRTVLLEKGRMIALGPSSEVIQKYLSKSHPSVIRTESERKGDGSVRFMDFRILGTHGEEKDHFFMGEDVVFRIALLFNTARSHCDFNIEILNMLGDPYADILNHDFGLEVSGNAGETQVYEITLPEVWFAPGLYKVNIGLYKFVETYEVLTECLSFSIEQGGKIKRVTEYSPIYKVYQPSRWARIQS